MSGTSTAAEQPQNEAEIVAAVERTVERIGEARARISRVIYGQDTVIEQCLVTLLAGGHGLLVGVPGLGKTLLVETLGAVLGLGEKRVQFTPDLMPADILGSEVLEESDGTRNFRFLPGPIFTQLLMADEINRASPRTQSALLQAMQESRVSIAGAYHALPEPFHVLATQNPIEQEGTYPLPEAQLDRFLMQINIDYPDNAAEREVILKRPDCRAPPPNRSCRPANCRKHKRWCGACRSANRWSMPSCIWCVTAGPPPPTIRWCANMSPGARVRAPVRH